jgi:hypothetical protein
MKSSTPACWQELQITDYGLRMKNVSPLAPPKLDRRTNPVNAEEENQLRMKNLRIENHLRIENQVRIKLCSLCRRVIFYPVARIVIPIEERRDDEKTD